MQLNLDLIWLPIRDGFKNGIGQCVFKNAYVICTLIKKKVQIFSLDHRYHKATNYILDLGKLDDDFYKKIPDISKIIEDQYVRKQFTDFDYLTVEISKVGKVFIYIFLVIKIVIYLFVYQIVLEERIF